MRFLITGGAGFIGSALANRLVCEGHHVRVIDDLSAGDPGRLDPAVVFTRGDVRDIPRLWTLLRGVDCVFHLAARVSVPESVLYPVAYNDVNVGGTVSLMEAARDAGAGRVIFSSSGAVYGEQVDQPISEMARPLPQSPYAASKIAGEQYVSVIGSLCGIETVTLRIFNVYGPGQPAPPAHAPVIPKFLTQVLNGGSVVIFGTGKQTRDFIYIDDVVDALVASGQMDGLDGAVINVGSGQETSIEGLVQKVAAATGRAISPLHNEGESSGPSRLVADLALARKCLAFEPKVDVDRGLGLVLELDGRFGKMLNR